MNDKFTRNDLIEILKTSIQLKLAKNIIRIKIQSKSRLLPPIKNHNKNKKPLILENI